MFLLLSDVKIQIWMLKFTYIKSSHLQFRRILHFCMYHLDMQRGLLSVVDNNARVDMGHRCH